MRSFIAFAVLGLASADLTSQEIAHCLVDGGEAVDDAADAALFIWAAYKRCGRQARTTKMIGSRSQEKFVCFCCSFCIFDLDCRCFTGIIIIIIIIIIIMRA